MSVDGSSGVVLTAAATAYVATMPDVVSYGEKVLSVLVLAMVAEAGRRLISWLAGRHWKKGSK